MVRQSCSTLRVASAASLVVSLVLLTLSACAQPSPEPMPTPVPSATPAPTEMPTVVPVPTSTLASAPADEPPATPPPTATEPAETAAPSAGYRLTFEATWSESTHPLDFPPNPHFSGLIGASHGPAARLWAEGERATPGIKNMAETGAKNPLDAEIDALIGAGSACTQISGGGISTSPGAVEVTLTVSQECPLVSVVSMIAPSPDWFVGVSGLSLYEGGRWVDESVVELFPYDAGTDSGTSYGSPNLPTESAEVIHRIETEPLRIGGVVPPLGTFTFTRLDE
jgi:hypothetical protein